MLKRMQTMCDGPPPNSFLHATVVAAHALLNTGTCKDGFLRSNLQWLKRASHWAEFSVIASGGVIHKGNFSNAMTVLSDHLPAAPGAGSTRPFAEGGALYALGLIFAGRGGATAAGIVVAPGAVAAASVAAGGGGGAAAAALPRAAAPLTTCSPRWPTRRTKPCATAAA